MTYIVYLTPTYKSTVFPTTVKHVPPLCIYAYLFFQALQNKRNNNKQTNKKLKNETNYDNCSERKVSCC